MDKEYIISFSSFYKAAYAQEVLADKGINSSLKKLPPELIRSCGTGLYLRNSSIQDIKSAFDEKSVVPKGYYNIKKDPTRGRKTYTKV